ncbi:hypothetical protein [Collimonas arenae]|uniref:hypothetical protein n=1 Tax=Collimonas arenae TaxID=279058 RepID=UPI000ACD4C62|nr:hypothetical protein [Collimonas arenae]
MKNLVSMAVSATLATAIVGGGIFLMSNSTYEIPTKRAPAEMKPETSAHSDESYATASEKRATGTAMQPWKIVKCESGGKTIYTDAPCPTSSHTEQVTMHDTSGGFVSPDKNTIADTRARIQAEIKQPGFVAMAGESTPALTSNTQGQCYYLAEEIKSIDSASNIKQSSWSQDQLRARRLDVRNRMYRLGC